MNRLSIKAEKRTKTMRPNMKTMVPIVINPLKTCGWTAMSSAIPPVLMVSVNHLKTKVRYEIQISVQDLGQDGTTYAQVKCFNRLRTDTVIPSSSLLATMLRWDASSDTFLRILTYQLL